MQVPVTLHQQCTGINKATIEWTMLVATPIGHAFALHHLLLSGTICCVHYMLVVILALNTPGGPCLQGGQGLQQP